MKADGQSWRLSYGIYYSFEEEKRLNAKQRVRKLREESEKFMLERKLDLRQVKPKELKHIIA